MPSAPAAAPHSSGRTAKIRHKSSYKVPQAESASPASFFFLNAFQWVALQERNHRIPAILDPHPRISGSFATWKVRVAPDDGQQNARNFHPIVSVSPVTAVKAPSPLSLSSSCRSTYSHRRAKGHKEISVFFSCRYSLACLLIESASDKTQYNPPQSARNQCLPVFLQMPFYGLPRHADAHKSPF